MEWLTLVHRLRVQDPWLKVLQQEQVVAVQEQPVLLQEHPVLVHCTTQTVFSLTAESCRENVVIYDTVPRLPWSSPSAEECHANAVISDYGTEAVVVLGYWGSVPCECRDRE